MGLTEMPFHCLLKNVSLDLTMGVQNNSSKYCWIGRVFDLIYYSPKQNSFLFSNFLDIFEYSQGSKAIGAIAKHVAQMFKFLD